MSLVKLIYSQKEALSLAKKDLTEARETLRRIENIFTTTPRLKDDYFESRRFLRDAIYLIDNGEQGRPSQLSTKELVQMNNLLEETLNN